MGVSKPRTKGPTIPVQLSLTADAAVRTRARERNVSPGTYIARAIEGSLRADRVEAAKVPESNTSTKRNGTFVPVLTECRHLKRAPIAGGLARCLECGAVRDVHGRWRAG
jgi:hypothetical protein